VAAKDDDGPGSKHGPPPAVLLGRGGRFLLGLVLLVVGFLLLYSVVVVWPAMTAAAAVPATGAAATSTTIDWLGLSYTPSPDSAQLLVVILLGAIGSFLHAAVSFGDYVGNRRLGASWVWWYLLRLFVGASLAVLFYFAIRGGFFAATTTSSDVNPYGIAALAGLVGLFSKQASDKLKELFDTLFKVEAGYGDSARGDSIDNPAPTLAAARPPQVTDDGVLISLIGTGFLARSVVQPTTADGAVLKRTVKPVTPEQLDVTLEASDVQSGVTVTFTVSNPAPGGGESDPLEVRIDPLPPRPSPPAPPADGNGAPDAPATREPPAAAETTEGAAAPETADDASATDETASPPETPPKNGDPPDTPK
jgi:hypothetical protein